MTDKTLQLVSDALASIGAHRDVPVVVSAVDVELGTPPRVRISLDLHYRVASPVCCGEPGCYTGFLGSRRARVSESLRLALALDVRPRVTILATLRHEPGYRYSQLQFSARDWTATYEPNHFD